MAGLGDLFGVDGMESVIKNIESIGGTVLEWLGAADFSWDDVGNTFANLASGISDVVFGPFNPFLDDKVTFNEYEEEYLDDLAGGVGNKNIADMMVERYQQGAIVYFRSQAYSKMKTEESLKVRSELEGETVREPQADEENWIKAIRSYRNALTGGSDDATMHFQESPVGGWNYDPDIQASEDLYVDGAPVLMTKMRTFGSPFPLSGVTDPLARVYNSTIMEDTPMVIFLPGQPKGHASAIDFVFSGDNMRAVSALLHAGGKRAWAKKRYYTFQQSTADFYRHANVLIGSVSTAMGLSQNKMKVLNPDTNQYEEIVTVEIFEFENELKKLKDRMNTLYDEIAPTTVTNEEAGASVAGEVDEDYYGTKDKDSLPFFFDARSSTLDENLDTSYTASAAKGTLSDTSSKMRELMFIRGRNRITGVERVLSALYKLTSTFLSGGKMASGMKMLGNRNASVATGEILASTMYVQEGEDPMSKIFKTTKGGAMLLQAQNGWNMLMPDVWSDSAYTKQMVLNFKFFSPYGDRQSIFRHVYVPFLTLLTLALPRQTAGAVGYTHPYLLQVDSPGYFNIEMGYVSNLTFKRGGSEKLFTAEGYPRIIEVSLTLKDLYPVLMAGKTYAANNVNPGMLNFMYSLTGISIFNSEERQEALANIRAIGFQESLDPERRIDNIFNDYWNQFTKDWRTGLGQDISGKVGIIDYLSGLVRGD